jgi:hypothetical protein
MRGRLRADDCAGRAAEHAADDGTARRPRRQTAHEGAGSRSYGGTAQSTVRSRILAAAGKSQPHRGDHKKLPHQFLSFGKRPSTTNRGPQFNAQALRAIRP